MTPRDLVTAALQLNEKVDAVQKRPQEFSTKPSDLDSSSIFLLPSVCESVSSFKNEFDRIITEPRRSTAVVVDNLIRENALKTSALFDAGTGVQNPNDFHFSELEGFVAVN